MFLFFKSKIEINGSLPLGKRGERFAQELYRTQKYIIIAENEFNRTGKQAGEIDFIATSKSEIIFVEVKTRSEEVTKHGSGADAVNYYKQQKLLLAVKLFFLRHPEYLNLRPKIDVCIVVMGRLDKEPKSVTIISNAVDDLN